MNIVTGYTGTPHVTSQQDRYINQSAFGSGSYVLPIGNQFSATIDSATQVTVADGAVSIQGCVAVIEYGVTEALTITAGTTGTYRNDLIVAEYTKDSDTGVEDVQLKVITGTSTSGTPSDPAYTEGTIAAGDTVVDFPLLRVVVEGVAITNVVALNTTMNSIEAITSLLTAANSDIMQRAYYLQFTNETAGLPVMWAAVGDLSSGDVFTFRGDGSFTQAAFAGSNVVSWGIGIKASSTAVVFLAVQSNTLTYATVRYDGTGTTYFPLNLNTNA